jgi:hypothetical protein
LAHVANLHKYSGEKSPRVLVVVCDNDISDRYQRPSEDRRTNIDDVALEDLATKLGDLATFLRNLAAKIAD